MKVEIVSGAKWLGLSLVLSSLILVGGLQIALYPREGPIPPVTSSELALRVVFWPVRVQELLTETEKLRQAGDEWDRFWWLDEPSHLKPFRTIGDLGP